MKKILGLTIAAILVMGLVGGGTWAYFSDPEASTGNILSAGTLDLKTNTTNGVMATLLAENLKPGDDYPSATDATIALLNDGSIDGASMDITFNYVEADNATYVAAISGDTDLNVGCTDDEYAAGLTVTTLSYNGTSLLGDVADFNANSRVDMQDVQVESDASSNNFTGLAGITSGATSTFLIRVQLDGPAADNTFMAQGIDITLGFTLQQQ